MNGDAVSPGFSCPDIAEVRGTCVQSPSNGCKYVGVFVSASTGTSQHGYGYSHNDVRCAGPNNETCTWCGFRPSVKLR